MSDSGNTPVTRRGAALRAAAARVVHAVVEDGRSLDRALREHDRNFSGEDTALLRNLAYGTLRYHYRIRAWLDLLLERRPRRRDRIVVSLLAVGLFQLTETRIPDHAVVSATVDAARSLGLKSYTGLINAVLRRFIREQLGTQPAPDDEARFNHPQWIIDRLRRDWPGHYEEILAEGNARAPMWLRVNTRRTTVPDYLSRLAAAKLDFAIAPGLPQAVVLSSPVPAVELPGFAEGEVSVQDAAAQVPAAWLLANGAGRVLDACAAPGGKTAHLLEIGGDNIELDAVDIDAERLGAVSENLERLQFDARLHAADVAATATWWNQEPYDRILLDAPCSASGVIRRHPDIKVLRRESDIAALAEKQTLLLDSLWPLLRPGGTLLYVTCSIFAAENDAVVGAFLARTPDAEPDTLLPNNNIRALMHAKEPGYQLLPGTRGMDGFYYAGLTRKD